MTIFWNRTLLTALLTSVFCLSASAAAPLPGLTALSKQTSVSGISSGGFMATQFHVAFSANLVGAGIVAGGPYFCAGSDAPGASTTAFQPYLLTASTTCMNPCKYAFWPFVSWCEFFLLPDGEQLANKAKALAADGLIDPLIHLTDDRIYLFSGDLDSTVATGVVTQAEDFYLSVDVPATAIKYDHLTNAEHGFISDNVETACDRNAAPFINRCGDYDQAREILQQIYGPLNPNAEVLTGALIEFDQTEFVAADRLALSALADNAFAYIPEACQSQSCPVHVVFHGCRQSAAEFDTNQLFFHDAAGYNEVADSNQIIVLYPQIRSRDALQTSPYNPKGCWDFWGYSGSDFYHKDAVQMSAVAAMIKRLQQPR
ncbi:MAG: hypothetical protein ACI9W6_001696 [Motiliproteus sp.]|jgi:hypothetical protein